MPYYATTLKLPTPKTADQITEAVSAYARDYVHRQVDKKDGVETFVLGISSYSSSGDAVVRGRNGPVGWGLNRVNRLCFGLLTPIIRDFYGALRSDRQYRTLVIESTNWGGRKYAVAETVTSDDVKRSMLEIKAGLEKLLQ